MQYKIMREIKAVLKKGFILTTHNDSKITSIHETTIYDRCGGPLAVYTCFTSDRSQWSAVDCFFSLLSSLIRRSNMQV